MELTSLEFIHLPISHLKNISIPKIIVQENVNSIFSAEYCCPTNTIIEGIDYSKGVIFIYDCTYIGSTITHEIRHHLQWVKFGQGIPPIWKPTTDYKKDIINFFQSNLREIDALLYQNKYASEDLDKEWIEWLNASVV